MAVYVAEAVDIDDLETLLTDNWDSRTGGEIPVPVFATSDVALFEPALDLTDGRANVNIHMEEFTEEQEGYAYEHVKQRAPVILTIWTRRPIAVAGGTDRQYLHDVKQELRRIVYANKHSLANWQVMKYGGFREDYDESGSVRFKGTMRLQLENDGVKVASERVAFDDFDRANGASLGGDWTADVGTWGIDTNQADLQSATADAIARYTGSTTKAQNRLVVDLITAAGMDAGLMFRRSANTTFWRFVLVESGGVHYARLIANDGGTDTQVAEQRMTSTVALDWTDGDTVELAVDLYAGGGMVCSVDGCPVFSRSDSFLASATGHGLYSNSDQTTRFD
ncbi:hypothetical protein LCGC14_2658350, partial [marine sediment metagenome]